MTHQKVKERELELQGTDQSTGTRKLIAVMIVMRMLMTRKVKGIKIMLMVKLREKVFTTIPCPVFLPGCKVGDFYLGFGKACQERLAF